MNDDVFRPVINPDPSLITPSPQTLGEALPLEAFSDLYRLVKEEGLPYFARLTAAGYVELFLVFESIDAFSEATRDAVSIEFKTYQQKLLAIIWTLSDPLHPLGFPLSFDIHKPEDRYMALRIAEQEETLIHYVAYADERITHIYTEAVTFSDDEKIRAEQYIRTLYEGNETQAQEAEVSEENILSIPAISLNEEVLSEAGTAYLLNYRGMLDKHGEEGTNHLLMSTIQQAVLVMRRHARSDVRECSFTVWVAERGDLLYLFVTPSLFTLFEVVHYSEEEANPFSRFLLAIPDYLETTEASPLQYGAYPILRYEKGKLYHLELDESTRRNLGRLFKRNEPVETNPYENPQ